MQQDLARREYHATPADAAPLRKAVAAGLPGSDGLAATLEGKFLQSPNRAHNLRTYYLEDRVAVVPRTAGRPDWLLTLRTEGVSRGAEPVEPLPPASPVSEGNQVRYTRGPVEEWYVNSADGVEQGWTLEQRPPGNGELRLGVAVGGLVADVGDDGIRFRGFGPGGATALNYDKLLAFDATGKTLPARLEATAAGFGIVVDDRDANYPITIDPLLSTPDWQTEGDQGGANFGVSVDGAGDVNGDGFTDVIVGADRFDNGQIDEGAAFLFLGSASGPSATPDWQAESDQASAAFGRSVAGAGDVNGDGFADVIVGAFRFSNYEPHEGAAFVFFGSASGLSNKPDWQAESDSSDATFGFSVAGAGDVNGDGFADVIVGAHGFSNGEPYEGAAFVFFGSASGLSNKPDWQVESDQDFALLGRSVAGAGDVNGDGFADVIVGAPTFSNGEAEEGAAFVFLGSASGLSTTPSWQAESDQAGATFGRSVAGADDVNGDGFADVIVGANEFRNGELYEGAAFVFFGSASGLSNKPDWQAESDSSGANFGFSVAGAGDVNGDGFADVIVGAPLFRNGEPQEGAAFVFLGSASGLSTKPDWQIESDKDFAQLGGSVAGAGDVNGDGFADVIVGAFRFSSGEAEEGAAFAFLGGIFTVGGSVSGLEGTGLVLQNNGGDDLLVSVDGGFTFPTALLDGASYAVTVATQPTNLNQTCTVTNGSGTLAGADVTNVQVDCVTDTFTVGGSVSGLEGTGLVLQNNGGDDLLVSVDGGFTFPTALADGSTYQVTVATQPTPTDLSQTCTVTNGSGTLAGANVTNIQVDCVTDTFTIGGSVAGLGGTGLVLQNNGGDDLLVSADGGFTFPTALLDGASYAVTVATQPTNLNQTCTVTNGSGTLAGADVTAVHVDCVTDTFTVGGTVAGLEGTGLMLQNNGGDALSISADGAFTFSTPLKDGESYSVTIASRPIDPKQLCSVTDGEGNLSGGPVNDIAVDCLRGYSVGGSVSGLRSPGLVIDLNNKSALLLEQDADFTFPLWLTTAENWGIQIIIEPDAHTCTASPESGVIGGSDIESVAVECSTDILLNNSFEDLASEPIVID